MRKSLILAAAAAAVLAAPIASAWEAGDFYVRVGASNVDPDDPNGDLDLSALDDGMDAERDHERQQSRLEDLAP